MNLRTFYYVTVRDIPGYTHAYLGIDDDGGDILALAPGLFYFKSYAESCANSFTEKHGGTAKVHEVQLPAP